LNTDRAPQLKASVMLLRPACRLTGNNPVTSSDTPEKIRANDVELHYVEKGKGVPVVFIHGGAEDYSYWLPLMDFFSQGYRAIVYSRRYSSPNSRPVVTPDYSALDDAEDLAGMIEKLGLGIAHLIGHSYGALGALFLAVRQPEMVRTLVLAEAPLLRLAKDAPGGETVFEEFMTNAWEKAGRAFESEGLEQGMRVLTDYFYGLGALDQIPESERERIMGNALEMKALTMSEDAFPALSHEEIKRIKVPTLLLSGEQTLEIHKYVDRELERLLPDGERVVIPNASHEMWAEYPKECAEAVRTFLAKH
jgi:pimeloyl-ACP methyl ester carboxylesterase